jgi:hypothetical protein
VIVSPEPNKAAVRSRQTYNAVLSSLLTAWKMTYWAIIKFPTKFIAFLFPFNTATLVAGIHVNVEKDKYDSTAIQGLHFQLLSGHMVKDVSFCYELYIQVLPEVQDKKIAC